MQETSVNKGRFSEKHPLTTTLYFAFMIIVTMFSTDPRFIAVSFICSFVYSVVLRGMAAVKFNCLALIPIVIFMTVINGFFVHSGETILFYINTNPITREAFEYGLAASVLLGSVIIWFSCFNAITTSDKIVYLFGRIAPVLGLTLSMIFRFVPLLKARFREIRMGQQCLYGNVPHGGVMWRIRQFFKEISILISWSLESSIETADSMEARGYGLKGRTSFHLFRITPGDMALTGIFVLLGGFTLAACVQGETSIFYFPRIVFGEMGFLRTVSLAAYAALGIFPAVYDLTGEKKWNSLNIEA